MQHKRFTLFRRLVAPLVFVALLVCLAANARAITDYVRLFNYQPPSSITSLADQTTMTDYGRKLFYVNHPSVADRSTFNTACSSNGEQTIVLGCYHPIDRGIYIYSVSDTRLNGVEQVTAAHEMLHAAYDRLSSSEKTKINAELQDFYDNNEHDQRIRDTIAAYQKSEPNDVTNEMHSIFGTEASNLPPALETYYKKYFTDREKVVSFADDYQQEFTSREDTVKADDAKLQSLKSTIDYNKTKLSDMQSAITNLRNKMDDERSSGDIARYNADVPSYNNQVDTYNSLVRTTQADITAYNQLVSERNSIALQVQQLSQSISSQRLPLADNR